MDAWWSKGFDEGIGGVDSEGRRGSVKVEGVRFLSLCGLRGPMRMKDLLVGKSALSYLNQSLRLEPLAAQSRCTLSPFDLLVEILMVQLCRTARRKSL